MAEQTPPSVPAAPVSQATPAMPQASSVVVPPLESPKKSPSLLWLIIILAVAILGGSTYFLYAQLLKPVEKATTQAPGLVTQESKPDQGFGAEPTTTPATTPTITSSDSISDIDKDLSGTTVESENASEFDSDLQSL
ncbi:hypothetical protein HY411_00550 [Candidatus Gottesmanbacteria bacterium]|nr:hypothetical protein [Candidatus Gottesmanbacteria bacterium]